MRRRDPADLLLVAVACATGVLLALTEQYASLGATVAAYTIAWWLLCSTGRHHHPYR